MTKAIVHSDRVSEQTEDPSRGTGAPGALNGSSRPVDDDPSVADLAAEYGYYVELSSAKDVGEFRQKIDDAVKTLGFSDYAFVRLAKLEDSGELNSFVPGLIDAYYNQGLYEYDVGLQHATEKVTPVFRSTIYEYVFQAHFNCEHTRCMREVKNLNESFGYYDCYNVPTNALDGNGHVQLSISQRGLLPADFKKKVRECHLDLELLCAAIDFVSTRKFPGQLIGEDKPEAREIILNPRPLLVLDMLANNDLNITQVAEELGINVVTANRHLQAARKAFDVKTNYAAIRQAVLSKLIKYK